jgi:hypothetical protein
MDYAVRPAAGIYKNICFWKTTQSDIENKLLN